MSDDTPQIAPAHVVPGLREHPAYPPDERTLAIVVKFLRQVVLASGRPARAVELRQLVHSQPNRALVPWGLSGEVSFERLATEIVSYAQADSDAFATPQTYVVVAYFGDERLWGATSPAFRLRSSVSSMSLEGLDPNDVLETEPATRGGQLAQSMRLTEAFARITVGSFATQLGGYQQEVESLRKRVSRYEELHMENLRLREQLMDEKHRRDLEAKREERMDQLRGRIIEDVSTLLPTVVNQFLRSRGLPALLPERVAPFVELLDRVLGGLTPDEISAIMPALHKVSPARAAAFAELYNTMRAIHVEKEAKARAEDGATEESKSPNGSGANGSGG